MSTLGKPTEFVQERICMTRSRCRWGDVATRIDGKWVDLGDEDFRRIGFNGGQLFYRDRAMSAAGKGIYDGTMETYSSPKVRQWPSDLS
jgi:hypothetical protein